MLVERGGRGSVYTVARKLLVIGAVGFLVAPMVKAAGKRLIKKKELAQDDARVDKNLQDTFPASDPPASHFVDIPVNRQ